jgi:uncharacterized protein (DUF488 family)
MRITTTLNEIKSDKTDHVALHKGCIKTYEIAGRDFKRTLANMTRAFFTIGHSTRSIDEFVGLLRNAGVRIVVDVRSMPRSRTNPQYNSKIFQVTLSEFKIGYEHIAALGGLRGRNRDVPEAVNAFWQNQKFHNYADYALSESFCLGLNRLRELGHASPCAIMCAEVVWWRCHRRIIADYLIANGETVFHILGRDRIELAHLTDAARTSPAGALTYPANL